MARRGHRKRSSITLSGARRLLKFELLGHRRVLASITGSVFSDVDQSFHRDEAEIGLENRVVYLDLDENGKVSQGEPVELTDESGQFVFEDLPAGQYVVRLFNGTDSQIQNTPFLAEEMADPIPVVDPFSAGQSDLHAHLGDSQLFSYSVAGRRVTELNLETLATRWIDLPADIVDVHALGEGRLITLLKAENPDSEGNIVTAAFVSFDDGQVVPLEVGPAAEVEQWSEIVIGADGQGLLLPMADAGTNVPLHTVDFDAAALQWTTTPVNENVDAGAELWGEVNSPVILVAQPSGSGTQVALWSTVTSTVVPGSVATLSDVQAVLAFDDAAALAVVRVGDGGVRVLDAANGFATLHQVDEFRGPVALDGHRELLFGMLHDTVLGVFDIHDGLMLPSLTLQSTLGQAAGLAISDGGDRITIRRPGYASQVRIDRPGAHRVSLLSDTMTKDVVFGMYISGDNLAPEFPEAPHFSLLEDTSLQLNAPGLTASIANPEGDEYLTLQISQAANGTAIVSPDGALFYRPNPNFFGTDSFEIRVSDGRDITEVTTVTIDVMPVDDPPRGINIDIPDFPENIEGPAIIGNVDVDEVDGDNYIIWLSDPRFAVQGNDIIIVAGAEFDHEGEPFIELTVIASNPENESDSTTASVLILVEDINEPPTEILPDEANVEENRPGEVIAELSLVDPDSTEGYTLETSDVRFVIEGMTLKLKPEIALDFETSAEVVVPVSVRDSGGEELLSQVVLVHVADNNDPVEDILLSGRVVPERASGYTVGLVSVVDQDAEQIHEISVNDDRFEIIEQRLKLRDGVYVRHSDQSEILITITANDQAGSSLSKDFVLLVAQNDTPFHNPDDPTDVDGDGHTDPLDALIIINDLNNNGIRPLIDPVPHELGQPRFYDVNGDGRITPIDALIIINLLNRRATGAAEPGSGPATSGEGEATPSIADDSLSSRRNQAPVPVGGPIDFSHPLKDLFDDEE